MTKIKPRREANQNSIVILKALCCYEHVCSSLDVTAKTHWKREDDLKRERGISAGSVEQLFNHGSE